MYIVMFLILLKLVIFLMSHKGVLNQERVEVPRLKIEPVERGFADHNKCFKLCLKVFDVDILSKSQKQCIATCLQRYRESERYMVEKVHKIMHEQAMANPEIKSLYDGVSDQARKQVGDRV